ASEMASLLLDRDRGRMARVERVLAGSVPAPGHGGQIERWDVAHRVARVPASGTDAAEDASHRRSRYRMPRPAWLARRLLDVAPAIGPPTSAAYSAADEGGHEIEVARQPLLVAEGPEAGASQAL